MTLESQVVITEPLTPNGVTTVFPFSFEVDATDEVAAFLDGVELDPALYSTTLNDDGTGWVTFFTAPTGTELVLATNPTFDQTTSFGNQGPYFQRTIQRVVDRLAMRALWLRARVELVFPSSLLSSTERQGKFLGWDASGNPLALSGVGTDGALRTDLADASSGARLVKMADGSTLNALFSGAEESRYVSPSGSDTTGTGTFALPYRTIQKAWDSLPRVLPRQATIWLMPGTHSENYLDPATTDKVRLPRPAVLFATGRVLASRTQNNAGVMSGPVVIKAYSGSKADTFIQTSATYTYGVYVEACQVAIQNVTIRAGANATGLVMSHRAGAYVHTYDCDFKRNGFTIGYGLAAESGGHAEVTGLSSVFDGGDAAVSAYHGAVIDIAAGVAIRNATVGVSAAQATVSLQTSGSTVTMVESTCTLGIAGDNASIVLRGESAGVRVVVDATMQLDNCQFTSTYADVKGLITTRGGSAYFNASRWQRQWTYYNTTISLSGAKSFTTGTQNTDSHPLVGIGPAPTMEGMVAADVVGNAAGFSQQGVQGTPLTFNADGSAGAVDAHSVLFEVQGGGGANRANCYLTADFAWEGRRIIVLGTTWGVQFVDGSTMRVPTGGVWVGNGQGQRRSAEFIFYAGRWHLLDPATSVTVADAAAMTYAAPSGGATIDANARTALGQLAADVTAIRTTLNAKLLADRNAGSQYI